MQRMKQLPPTAHPILSIHCENTSICDYATEDMQSQPLDTLADWNRTHPNLAEGEAVRRAAYFAREMGVRTYVVHSSTREAVEALGVEIISRPVATVENGLVRHNPGHLAWELVQLHNQRNIRLVCRDSHRTTCNRVET